jgi:hypothetical protein
LLDQPIQPLDVGAEHLGVELFRCVLVLLLAVVDLVTPESGRHGVDVVWLLCAAGCPATAYVSEHHVPRLGPAEREQT